MAVAPTNEGDYTGVLGSILGVLTGIKDGVTSIPANISSAINSISVAVVGDMTIERKNTDLDFDITMVFPFCIPFDLIRMFEDLQTGGSGIQPSSRIKTLSQDSMVQGFSISGGGAPRYSMELYGYTWVLDFADYTVIRDAIRWALWITTVLGLMVSTGKFIKWGD